MSSARTLNPLRKLASIGLAFAVAATTIVATSALSAGTAQAADSYYPWAKVASTGDYLADAYTGLSSGHVFENVTTDRLLDILSSNGNYYIAFAGPEHPASQALLPVIDAAARAKGITKIYHFDPYVDGYQLDSTLKKAGSVDVTGGNSVNFTGSAKISDVWKLITQLLPAGAVASGGALEDYAGDTALLLNVNITDRKNVETGKAVTKLAELKDADVAAFNADTGSVKTDAAAALNTVFTGKTSSVRTQFEFFSRLYNASATKTETATAASADRYGSAVTIFDPTDYPNPGDFVLKSIDVKELYNLLNSTGEFPILFAGQGCHNTQAIIGSVAKRAKELHLPVVYVVDFALDSNVKFGTGDLIDTASKNSATGGLWIRSGAAALSTTEPYQFGYSYLYGKIAEYFGPNWITENSSKKSNSVAYYPNAVLGETSTTNPFAVGFDPATQLANATRLQVPTIVRYNKDAANPIVGEWLHKDKVADGADQTYTEYMLELSWVRGTDLAKADSSRVGRDGLTKAEFGAEAVASLDRVLTHNGTVVHQFSNAPTPWIEGTAAVGQQLIANLETNWSQSPNLVYQWRANGVNIPGANADRYTLTSAEKGKKITVTLTGSRPDYQTTTTISDPTAAVASSPFTTAPIPTISGTAQVGLTLTADPGTWELTATLAYSWKANGKTIKGATAASYKLKAAEGGKKITVTVTGSASGYVTQAKTSVPTAAVVKVFSKTPAPKIKGSATVDATLKASISKWSPGAKFSYQWLADGTPILGATKSSLKLNPTLLGVKISLSVTGSKGGYASVTKTSSATKGVVAAKFSKAPTPKITGKATVGTVLGIKLGTWSPKAGVVFSYQWFAGGVAIDAATASTFTLTPDQLGQKITVKVTATKDGYVTTTKAAKATAAVK